MSVEACKPSLTPTLYDRTTWSNTVFAPVTRPRCNMKVSLGIQPKTKELLLLAPARYQHHCPHRRASQRVRILSIGAVPQFIIWHLHLKDSFGFVIGETKLYDGAPSAFSNPVLCRTFFSSSQRIHWWRRNTYDQALPKFWSSPECAYGDSIAVVEPDSIWDIVD